MACPLGSAIGQSSWARRLPCGSQHAVNVIRLSAWAEGSQGRQGLAETVKEGATGAVPGASMVGNKISLVQALCLSEGPCAVVVGRRDHCHSCWRHTGSGRMTGAGREGSFAFSSLSLSLPLPHSPSVFLLPLPAPWPHLPPSPAFSEPSVSFLFLFCLENKGGPRCQGE